MVYIAEWSSFFNSYQGDRRYTAGEFVEYFATFIGNGVFYGGTALQVLADKNLDIKVNPGKAWINGYYYINRDAPKTITLSPAHMTMPRIDRVVLRLDLSKEVRRVFATVKTGTPSDTPTAPGLRRDNAIHELGLADIRVNAGATAIVQSNITDLRLSSSYCGIVVALIQQPDLTSIFNQYQSKYSEVSTGWDTWFASTKGNWNTVFSDIKTVYNGWFSQIKAELFAQANTIFDDWGRQGGYRKLINFLGDGNIQETLQNKFNNSTLATRTTEFLSDGSIKETLSYNEPRLKVTRTTTFSGSLITEDITEVT